jgi:hypothetical protein
LVQRLYSLLLLVTILAIGSAAQTSGAVQPVESKYRLLKSISGSKGEDQAGRFVILDPRTIFYVPDDKKIIAYFEWDGPTGPHHFEALWKNPEGKVSIVSDFRYDAKQRRFAGYWELLLSESMLTGVWTVEARIDGEAAGVHNFQIISAAKPAITENTKKLLSLSDVYKKATAATVKVENLGAKGNVQREGLGFFLEGGSLVVAFQTIDGAKRLRLVSSSTPPIETDQIVALNSWEDWAVLKVEGAPTGLPKAGDGSWSVGDRCFTLNTLESGGTVIVDGQITGIQKQGRAGERLNIASTLDRKAVGAPLLNEYGEVVGLIGGVPFPGAYSTGDTVVSTAALRLNPFPSSAVPISQVKTQGTAASISTWEASGSFMPAVRPLVDVSRSGVARKVVFNNGYPETQDERSDFKRSDKQVTVYVAWTPQKKLKGIGVFRLFASNNNLLLESKASKMNFDPNDRMTSSTWNLGIGQLPPDIYRVDIRLDAETIWRGFFRVVE